MKFRIVILLSLLPSIAFIHSSALGMDDSTKEFSSPHAALKKSDRDIVIEMRLPIDELASTYSAIRKTGNGASASDLVEYIVGPKSWPNFSLAEQEKIVVGIASRAQRLDLGELVSTLNVVNIYKAIRKSGNTASDEELVAYLLKIPTEKWVDIRPENQKWVVAKVTGKPYEEEIARLAPVAPSTFMAPFVERENVFTDQHYKALRARMPSLYTERSRLYAEQGANYPNMPMIHTYHSAVLPPPFGAEFLAEEVSVPPSLSKFLNSANEQAFFFNVQEMETGRVLAPQEIDIIRRREAGEVFTRPEDININNGVPSYYIDSGTYKLLPHTSFKPHYAIYPEALSRSAETYETEVQWTVVPGGEGKVVPEQGEKDELWDEKEIYVHPTGLPLENPDTIPDSEEKKRVLRIMEEKGIVRDTNGLVNMDDINGTPELMRVHPETLILSGDVMHLKGIVPTQSVDFYSLAIAKGKSFVTYHWTLTPGDFEKFNEKLATSRNLRELIQGLKAEPSLKNLLGEFQKYVGYSEK